MKHIAYVLMFVSGFFSTNSSGQAASGDIPVGRGESLRITPPLPIWPSDYETTTQRHPVFRINGRFNATTYRVELARDAAFSDLIILTQFDTDEASGITPVVFVPYEGEPLSDGRYYWRVFCGDGDFETPPANYRTFLVSARDSDAIDVPAELPHPRLIPVEKGIERVRGKLRSRSQLMAMQFHINAARNRLDIEPPDESYAKAGQGQHGNYSTAASWYQAHLVPCAFVARVTQDRELLDKSVEMLLTPCRYERWLGPLFDDPKYFDPPWNSALETAMMTRAVATAYDLLHEELTEEQRELVRDALAIKGIAPLIHDWADPVGSSQLPRHQVPTGNWVMVCTSAAGTGALALLNEHPDAPQWVRVARNRVRAWLLDRGGDWYVDNPNPNSRPDPIPVIGPSEPNFGVDGGYKESIGYMNYAMHHVVAFADPLRSITGENLMEHVPDGLLDPLAWSLMARETEDGIDSRIVPFGDCGDETSYYELLLAACIKHQNNPLAAWMYERFVPVPKMVPSMFMVDSSVAASPPERAVPMKVFRTVGQVVMRADWSPDAPMAAMKFHQNRGHLDVGTFFLSGGGGRTLIEGGVTGYGGQVYRDFSHKSLAHNLVLVDDQSQHRVDGTLLCALATSQLAGCSGELKAAYPEQVESWRRDMIMLPDRACIVIDRLKGKGEHRYNLLLHPDHPFVMSGDNEFRIGEDVTRGHVQVYSDRDIASSPADGYDRTLPRQFLRFDSVAGAVDQSFVTAVHWPRDATDQRELVVEPVQSGQWVVMQRQGGDILSRVIVGPVESNDIASDGALVAVWQDTHLLLFDGTYLKCRGEETIRSSVAVNAAIERSSEIRISFWNEQDAEVRVAVDATMRFARLDGRAIEFKREDGALVALIPVGEHELWIAAASAYAPRQALQQDGDIPAIVIRDAPAYHPEVKVECSTQWAEPLNAIDGDINTIWTSLPGVPMPQWYDVELPEPQRINQVRLVVGYPLSGTVRVHENGGDKPARDAEFRTTATELAAEVTFEPVAARRISVHFDWIDPNNGAARIAELTWKLNP